MGTLPRSPTSLVNIAEGPIAVRPPFGHNYIVMAYVVMVHNCEHRSTADAREAPFGRRHKLKTANIRRRRLAVTPARLCLMVHMRGHNYIGHEYIAA